MAGIGRPTNVDKRTRHLLSAKVDKQALTDFKRIAHALDLDLQIALDDALKMWANVKRGEAMHKLVEQELTPSPAQPSEQEIHMQKMMQQQNTAKEPTK